MYERVHPADRDLIMAADGELPSLRKVPVAAHLESRWSCRKTHGLRGKRDCGICAGFASVASPRNLGFRVLHCSFLRARRNRRNFRIDGKWERASGDGFSHPG